MHRPDYVQGGQEASFGYLLLGVYYRRIPGDTPMYLFFHKALGLNDFNAGKYITRTI
jgi:hypothetical protein